MRQQTLNFRTGVGWSGPLPAELDSPQTLLLAFGAPQMRDQGGVFAQLAKTFAKSLLLGCSTAGEISGEQVSDASISLAVTRFDHTGLRRASTPIQGAADSENAGARLAAQLQAPHAQGDLSAVFLLSDGLHVNGTTLVKGLRAGLPAGTSISGGLAGDGSHFVHTWVLDEGQPQSHRVCAVGFYGPRIRVGHGCDAGWSDFGPERHITRAEGNVLFELDGRPALALYKEYLGDRAQGLPSTALLFPLEVRRSPGPHEQALVRTILAVNEAEQSMTFAGDIPQGGTARLMRANNDKLIDSAGSAARQACHEVAPKNAALVVSVSCVGRRLVLGERTEEEVETVIEAAPQGSAHVGFYSYGEITPAKFGGVSELHNQTMTVTVFSEV